MAAMFMGAVSTSNEFEQSLPLINAFASMASTRAPNSDSLSLSEAKYKGGAVTRTETQSLPADEEHAGLGGCKRETEFLDNDMEFSDLPPFTIRNFVSTVRAKDFSKCWPFPHRILESCLRSGKKPQLPPFNPPRFGQVCLHRNEQQEPMISNSICEQVVTKVVEVKDDHLITQALLEGDSKQKLLSNGRCMAIESLVEASGKEVSRVQERGQEIEAPLEEKQTEEGKLEVQKRLERKEDNQFASSGRVEGASDDRQEVDESVIEVSEEYHDRKERTVNEDIGEAEMSNDSLSHADQEIGICGIKDLEGGGRSKTDVTVGFQISCSESEDTELKPQDTKSHKLLELETISIQETLTEGSFHCEDATIVEGQWHKTKCRPLSTRRELLDLQVEKLCYSNDQSYPEVSAGMKLQEDESRISEGLQVEKLPYSNDQGYIEVSAGIKLQDDESQILEGLQVEKICYSNDQGHPEVSAGMKPQEDESQTPEGLQVEKLCHSNDQGYPEASAGMELQEDESQISEDGNTKFHKDVSTKLSVDNEFVEQQDRLETGKSGEDSGVIGVSSDPLVPQVCPVCRNFTSTSNTALNAHIDHCLATALPGERNQVRLHKHRIKARKKRSMIDICAAAPARTLEDLELSSQRWAFNEVTTTEKISCSFGWKDGVIRRQPRTPLYRGPAGARKGNGEWEQESERQHFVVPHSEHKRPQIEECIETHKVRKKCLVRNGLATNVALRPQKLRNLTSPSVNISDNVVVMLQKSHADQHSHGEESHMQHLPEPSKSVLATSSIHTGKLGLTRPNKLAHKSESLRVAAASRSQENVPIDSPMDRNLGKCDAALQVLKGSGCSSPVKVLSGRSSQHDSAKGSPPSLTAPEKAIKQCYARPTMVADKVKSNLPDTAASWQSELAAAKKRKSALDPVSTHSCNFLQWHEIDEILIDPKKRKKKKNGSSNLVSAQCNLKRSADSSLPNMEVADCSWSGRLDCHGIIPVDTSAEEANKLSWEFGRPMDLPLTKQSEVQTAEPLGSAEVLPNGSGENNDEHLKFQDLCESLVAATGKQQTKTPFPDSKGVSEASKKRRSAHTEVDSNTKRIPNDAVDERVGKEHHFERPIKNKKGTLKIKSIVNIATDLEDKESNLILQTGCGDLDSQKGLLKDGWQKQTVDPRFFLKTASVNGSSNHQASSNHQTKILKRKHPATMKGIAMGEVPDNAKHVRLDPAGHHLSFFDLDLDCVTQRTKSPEGSSVVSNGALAEHRLQGGVESDSTDAASQAKEIPQGVKETEFGNSAENLRISTSSRLNISQSWSQKLNQEAGVSESVKQSKISDVNTNKLDKAGQTQETEANQANIVLTGHANCTNTSETSRKSISTVRHGGTRFISVTEALKERVHSVSLHKQTLRRSPVSSATSISTTVANKFSTHSSSICVPPTPISSVATITDISTKITDSQQRMLSSSMSQEAAVSKKLSCLQSADSISNSHVSYASTAVVAGPALAASTVRLNYLDSSPTASSARADNPEVSAAASAVRVVKCDVQIAASTRRADDSDVSNMELALKAGTPDVSVVASDSGERTLLMANQNLQNTAEAVSTVSGSTLFLGHKNSQKPREAETVEGLQKVIAVAHSGVNANDLTTAAHNSQNVLIPVLAATCTGSMVSPPTSLGVPFQDKCKSIHEAGVLEQGQRATRTHQKMTFQSVDLARTMVDDCTDTRRARDTMPHMFIMDNNIDINNQQNNFNTNLQGTLNGLHHVHEQVNLMPLQEIASNFNSEVGGGSFQPQILQSAMQMMNGSSSTSNADHVNLMPGNFNGSGQMLGLPSDQPIAGQFSSAGMLGRREHSSGAGLTSRLSGFGSVDYPGEQGVVHIFGNPVFKLMGKNVMVTNKDGKPLGMENPLLENGRRGFPSASSVRHLECMETAADLDLMQESHSQFPQPLLEAPIFMNQDLFSSSQVGAWHGDASKPRTHSVARDGLDIHLNTAQNLSLPSFGNVDHSGYRDSAMRKPPSVPLAASGERIRAYGSAGAIQLRRQQVANSSNQPHAEVIVIDDPSPNGGNFMPSILRRGGRTPTQLGGRSWSANPLSLSPNDQRMHNQAPPLLCRPNHVGTTDFLADLHKLGLTASSSFHSNNQRSGTLSDIVQSSDRSQERLWNTLSGSSLQQTQFKHT